MKLGGSVITDKTRYRTPRLDALGRLASELAHAPGPLVLVHGAGSYGHVVAKTHELAKGDDGSAPRRQAFAQVHADVRELGGLVLAALHQAGVPAVWHSTFDLARLDAGRLVSFATGAIAETLRAGFVPVISGDGALDASRGFGILSGDVLMVALAEALRPTQAVFVADVDGVHDRWPGGALLERIGPNDRPFAGESAGHDITGGMAGKLERAREVARFAPVRVVNGLVAGRVADALAGKDVVGTRVDG